ncbi:MAG: hypothetical protein ACYTGC_20375 [Planctomycetota bacterium]|jgi:hypothetical protein
MNEQQTDQLISTIVADEAGEELWKLFVTMADERPELWKALARAQRDQRLLVSAVREAVEVAERVRVGETSVEPRLRLTGDAGSDRAPKHDRWRWPWLIGWSGWGLAAAVIIAAFTGPLAPRTAPVTPVAQAPPTAVTPAQALENYLTVGQQSGQVLGEMPTKVLLDSRPAPSGQGLEVLYLRGVLERITVPDLYHLQQTESGQPALVRWKEPRRGSAM